MFTKKHYIAIAEMVGSQLWDNPLGNSHTELIIKDWCGRFERDNPRFDAEIFTNYVYDSIDKARGC